MKQTSKGPLGQAQPALWSCYDYKDEKDDAEDDEMLSVKARVT
jgi:hypothetical protein